MSLRKQLLAYLVALPGAVSAAGLVSLDSTLESLRAAQSLPGVAAVVLRDGVPVAEGAAGLRRLGRTDAIRVEDRFGIGSCTKRLTAFMIARLVDAGALRWDTTLADALPGVPMRDEYRSVTLEQLLSFKGGIAAYERIGPKITPELFDAGGSPAEREDAFVKHVLSLEPVAAPGTAAVYSNASYMLAAYAAAHIVGKDLATLMQEQVLTPLKLASAGWGRPWAPSRADQPWLHIARPDGHVPEPEEGRPPEELFRAAGGLHMNMQDLARFALVELQAIDGSQPWLRPATAQRWRSLDRPQPPGRVSYAGGTPWLAACYAVWPAQKTVTAFAVNGGTPGDRACGAWLRQVEQMSAS